MEKFKPNIKVCSIVMILLLATNFAFISCEDRFMPEIDSRYNEQLVVDGSISNLPGPYTVKLSLSAALGEPRFFPVSGFSVSIFDDAGNEEKLTETAPGTYQTSADGMQGVPGRRYKISLSSPQGKNYRSDFQTLNAPVAIDSIYPEVEYTGVNYYPYDMPGYRFYVDAAEAPKDSTYFLWQLSETYRYDSEFKIYFSYYDRILHPVLNKDTLRTCWLSQDITGFYMMNTASLSTPHISHFPLHYIPTEVRQLSVRYSLFTRQLVINEDAFRYWKSVKEQNTGNGDIYTKQLYQIRGNIYNPDDPEESVYGYFMTAGITEKRIFVDRPREPVKMYYPECFLSANDYEQYGWMFLGPAPPASNPLFVTEDPSGARALPHQACVNCQLRGGTTEKPDFWIDN